MPADLASPLPSLLAVCSGAFSSVHKAYDRNTKQKVAVKCVRKFELNSQQVRLPFLPLFPLAPSIPLLCPECSVFVSAFVPSFLVMMPLGAALCP